MALLQHASPGNGAIVDTVASVFRGTSASLVHPSLWVVIVRWIAAWIARALHALSGHPAANVVVRVTLVIALLAIVLRILAPGFTLPARGDTHSGHATPRDDWWGLAARLASEGAFTDAAHALYLALVTAAAARGLVSIHDSKTTGDYLREVRRAHSGTSRRATVSASELAGWRDFIRAYETAIYGLRTVSDTEYGTLRTLAATALGGGLGDSAPRERVP